MQALKRYQQARNITLAGAVTNAIQGIVKFVFGWLGHSHALVADGVHSLSDLITDILVIFAAYYGSQGADREHPYGHGRIETVATVALAVLIALAGLGIMYDSAEHFFTSKAIGRPHLYTLIIAVLSVIANEIIFRLTLQKARVLEHQLLEANAWHHRSDAASSAIVVVGIGGTMAGFPYSDVIAAVIVGVLIVKMGVGLAWSSVQELVDTGLDELTLNSIKNAVRNVQGVRALHQLRTRSMAGNILLDVHILVDGKLSVSEGHYISTQVETLLMRDFKNIVDVTVHVDPENDETSLPSQALPGREDLKDLLESRWKKLKGYERILALNIHYLNGKLILEVVLPLSILSEPKEGQALQSIYAEAIKDVEGVEEVYLLFR
jgi:cation diffusion facilitator family transporter